MIWHVPDGTEVAKYHDSRLYSYYSSNDFLAKDFEGSKGCGTLQALYDIFKPISQKHSCKQNNGPAVPVTFDAAGSASDFHSKEVAPNSRGESTVGYIHFSVFNNERGANALCPGIRYNGCNTEHACIGGGGYFPEGWRQCSDFSGWDWNGYGTHSSWSASKRITDATVMIFTR